VVKYKILGLAVAIWLVATWQPAYAATPLSGLKRDSRDSSRDKVRILENGSFSIGIEEESWAIESLIDPRDGSNFAVPAPEQENRILWELAFRADKGLGATIKVNSRAKPKNVNVEQRGGLYVKTWNGLDIGEDKAALDVVVRVQLSESMRESRWWISVMNRSSKYGLGEVVFPVVHLQPPNCDTEKYFCVLPLRTGRLEEAFPEQLSLQEKNTAERAEDAAIDESSRNTRVIQRYNLYPSTGMQMQFNAVYGENGKGLYVAAHDPGGNMKWFNLDSDMANRTILFKVTHFPDNEWYPSQRFVMDYPVVLRFFEGDWYDAARMYRQWAIKQPWCRLGPVSRRKDVPEWIKRGYIVLRNDWNGIDRTLENNRRNSIRMSKEFGFGLSCVWYQWWKGQGPNIPEDTSKEQKKSAPSWGRLFKVADGVVDVVAKIQQHGSRVLGYYNIRCYDVIDESDEDLKLARPNMARDLDGNIQYYNKAMSSDIQEMCFNSEWWRDRIVTMSKYLVGDLGFDGVYLDSFGRNARMCYDTSHGHAHGGAKHFLVGEHILGERVRQAIKKLKPQAAIMTEASVEYFIDVADLKLFHYNVIPDAVPLWTAVYHDYQVCYGRTISEADFTADSGKPFYMKTGNLFNMGAQIGRFFVETNECFPLEKGQEQALAFVKKVVAYKKLGHKYLTLGEMMRPPKILTPLPAVQTSERLRYPAALPAILSSAWRAGDGKTGIFFTNISGSKLEFEWEVLTSDYRYGDAFKTCSLKAIRADGTSAEIREFGNNQLKLKVTLAPYDILFYELVFEKHKNKNVANFERR
jgi:uncharacterized protein DUF6259